MVGWAVKLPGVFFQDDSEASEVNPPHVSESKPLICYGKKNPTEYISLSLLMPSFPRACDCMGHTLAVTERLQASLTHIFFTGSPCSLDWHNVYQPAFPGADLCTCPGAILCTRGMVQNPQKLQPLRPGRLVAGNTLCVGFILITPL